MRAKVQGTAMRPRLVVFRSNQHLYAQLVDDGKGATIASASDVEVKGKKENVSKEIGLLLAKKAKEQKVERVVFDRAGYAYHGRVKELAQGAREGGLQF